MVTNPLIIVSVMVTNPTIIVTVLVTNQIIIVSIIARFKKAELLLFLQRFEPE